MKTIAATTTRRLRASAPIFHQRAGALAHMARGVGVVAALLVAGACAAEPGENPPSASGAHTFVVIGDTPYSPDDEKMLAEALPIIHAAKPPFIIHVGDYKGGRAPCAADHDDRFAALIEALKPVPVFYTPGDNEWTDCDRNIDPSTGKNWSDLARLQIIRARFFASPPVNANPLGYQSQMAQIENATWRHRDVRFATVHVVATANGRDWVAGDPLATAKAAVEAREAANAMWLDTIFLMAKDENAGAIVVAMQADPTDVDDASSDHACDDVFDHDATCDAFATLRAQIRDLAVAFEKPVLLIHGDTPPFTLNQAFSGEEAANLWRLNAAGDVGGGVTGNFYGLRDVTLVTIDATGPAPFAAKGLLTGKAAKD